MMKIGLILHRLLQSSIWLAVAAAIWWWLDQNRLSWHSAGLDLLPPSVMVLAGLYACAAVFTLLTGPIAGEASAGLVVITMVVAVLEANLMARATSVTADLAGGLFMIAAVLYRGSSAMWWLIYVPVAGFALFGPMAWLEQGAKVSLDLVLRAGIVPSLSFIAGSLLATVRDTRQASVDALVELRRMQERSRAARADLQRLREKLRRRLASRPSNSADSDFLYSQFNVKMDTAEFRAPVSAHMSGARLTYADIHEVCSETMELLRQRMAKQSSLRLLLTASSDHHLPHVVSGTRGQLKTILLSLLAQSMDAIGRGQGVIRVTLRPTQSSVQIVVEDNGYGLSEAHLERKLADARASLFSEISESRLNAREIGREVEQLGGKAEFNSRLGVGARADVILPRIDSLARMVSSRAPVQARSTIERMRESSSNSSAGLEI